MFRHKGLRNRTKGSWNAHSSGCSMDQSIKKQRKRRFNEILLWRISSGEPFRGLIGHGVSKARRKANLLIQLIWCRSNEWVTPRRDARKLPTAWVASVRRKGRKARLKSKKPALTGQAEERFMEAWATGDYVVSRIWWESTKVGTNWRFKGS